ncbi:MAG TPA: hypothetical protein VNO33_18895 [Kofleriaceae bacterium]|nr:hypothetical protein [Kofleriaceae bacterium]
MTASKTLAERVAALRDEVLSGSDPAPDAGQLDRREPSGSEVFDAVIRLLSGGSRASAEVDLGLHDGIARRLAWRDGEMRILGDAREVCRRILSAARRALRDPDEEMEVAQAVAEAGTAAARILTLLVLGRVARERAALLREELAHERLGQATERQREELARLERALADALARSRA